MKLRFLRRRFTQAFASLITFAALAAATQFWIIHQLDNNALQVEQVGRLRAQVLRLHVALAQIRHADDPVQASRYQQALADCRQTFNQTLQGMAQAGASNHGAAPWLDMQAMKTPQVQALLEQARQQWQAFDAVIVAVLTVSPQGNADAVARALAVANLHSDVQSGLMEQLAQQVVTHHRTETQRMIFLNGGLLLLLAVLLFWLMHNRRALNAQIDFENSQLRHQASDAQQLSEAAEAQMQTSAKLSPDLIWVKNLAGVYQFCNRPYELFYGSKQADIVGKTDFDLTDEVTARLYQSSDRLALTQAEPLCMENWHDSGDQSRRCLFEIIKTPLLDAHDQVIGVQGVARDITLQRQTQAAFRQAQDRLMLLDLCIAKISDVVIITEAPQETIVFVNDAFERVTGYTRAQALGNTPHMLSSGDSRAPERLRMKEALRQQTAVRVELLNHTRSGQRLRVDMELTPVQNEAGQVSHWVGIQRDITERKKAEAQTLQLLEKAAESSRLKTEFMANVSHELRTPMNGVLGMAQVLLDTPLSARQQKYTQVLYEAAQSLMKILDGMLDFRKIEAGTLWLDKEPFSVSQLVNDCQAAARPKAQSRQLDITLLADADLPPLVMGDAKRIGQVLDHLLDNAVKFTERGGITLVASVMHYANHQPFLHFEVTDTGIGISDEQTALLFRPFVQVNGTITRSQGGTGLGLVLSSRLVELMHGHIGVVSALGAGTTVWFAVPLVMPPAASENNI